VLAKIGMALKDNNELSVQAAKTFKRLQDGEWNYRVSSAAMKRINVERQSKLCYSFNGRLAGFSCAYSASVQRIINRIIGQSIKINHTGLNWQNSSWLATSFLTRGELQK
jgi:hypothetical protein